ncbi:VIT1/CCC1 family protein [Enterococcus devriesei]|uniref:VIT1/CCC1 transporter family protein n=1 Tax=Enterococcus devriesei TaxID=319970 RepID=UPI0036D4063E
MLDFSSEQRKTIKKYQEAEITAYHLYAFLAGLTKDVDNHRLLMEIANDEMRHYNIWKQYTKQDVTPRRIQLAFFKLLGLIFGFTFSLKLMERGEDSGLIIYKKLGSRIPEIGTIMDDEEKHEDYLISLLNEERLQYVGAMILGLNDALVELTGTIAGLTFAMNNNRVVALSAIITGIAATLSMAASNYLAEKADGHKNPLKSSFFTGGTYLLAVVLLVLPYLLFPAHMYIPAFATMLLIVLILIAVFNFYISVTRDQPFYKAFVQMAAISFSVMTISYLIGLIAKLFLSISI